MQKNFLRNAIRLIARSITFPFRFLLELSKVALLCLTVALLALNVASVTSSAVFSAASSLVSWVPGLVSVKARHREKIASLRSRADRLEVDLKRERQSREAAEQMVKASKRRLRSGLLARQGRRLLRKQITNETKDRVFARIKRQAARNSDSVIGEAIPFLGVTVIAASIAYDIKDSCDTARELSGLFAAVETDGDQTRARKQAEDAFECTSLIPNRDDLPTAKGIWEKVKASPGAAWKASQGYYANLPEWSDVSSGFSSRMQWAWDWAGQLVDFGAATE